MRSPLRSPAQVEGPQGVLPQPGKALERPSSTRLEARFPYHGSGAMTRSPSPLAWRPDSAMMHFYSQVLGCPVERREDEMGLIQLRAGRSLLDLVPVDSPLGRAGGGPPDRQAHNMDHFCFRVEPFDEAAIRAHLEAAGVQAGALHSRYGAEGQGPSIYVTDPEGNTVELKGPPWEQG